MTIKFFLTGATGYIGGSVLSSLLKHKLVDIFEITVLVRSSDKAELLRSVGLKPVIGSNADLELLSKQADDADITIACADADDLDAAKAILSGLKRQFERTGKRASLIHTSGTGVLSSPSGGMFASETVYSDLDIAMIESLDIKQPHREVDVTLVEADNDGYVDTYIVLPSTIYGRASGLLVDKGIQKPFSAQIPELVQKSIDRGQAGVIGEGKNLWPNVEIHEVAALYIVILDHILAAQKGDNASPKEFGHGRYGFYFGENGEHSLLDVAKSIAKFMHEIGIGTAEPTPFTEDEMKHYFPVPTSLETNSRCRADRGKAIGWRPVKTTADMLASIEVEVKAFAKK